MQRNYIYVHHEQLAICAFIRFYDQFNGKEKRTAVVFCSYVTFSRYSGYPGRSPSESHRWIIEI